ncbi:MAG: FGGY-family carbohydrate kinase [Anaerolineae bacterium]
MYVCGIDLGTQGIRVIISDLNGSVKAEAAISFPSDSLLASQPGYFEQDPGMWRQALYAALRQAVTMFCSTGEVADSILALAVTSTSGTLCLVDDAGDPVRPALMYSDARAAKESEQVQEAGVEIANKLGSRFAPSYAICKLRWLQAHEPESLEAARWFLSPADLVTSWLSGVWGVADWTSALKWGYDVVGLCWPSFIFDRLGFDRDKFPLVQAPGSLVGHVSPAIASQTGLVTGTMVIAGATDGTASQFASGAVSPGQWNSTLGTTLVLKGVSEQLLRDPLGRVYCHRHPDGYWLPGGASSTGADCLAQRFPQDHLPALNQTALGLSPTDLIIYPLMRRGERFPFDKPEATGFILGEAHDEATRYTAHLEGLAYVERLAYEVLDTLGAHVAETICAVGGATYSSAGLQIRADVLHKRLVVPRVPSGAMGAAILAARGCGYATIAHAVGYMVHWQTTVEPRLQMAAVYDERYQRFVAACRERGYL